MRLKCKHLTCLIYVSRKPVSLHPGTAVRVRRQHAGRAAAAHIVVAEHGCRAAWVTGGAFHPLDGLLKFLTAILHGQQAPTAGRRPVPRCCRAPSARPRLQPLP